MATEVGSLTLKIETGDVKKAKADLDNLAQSAAKTEKEIGDVEQAAKDAAGPLKDLPAGAKKPLQDLPKPANDAGKGLDAMGRKAGMAGIQVEQMVGQIAAGQNPLRAIGVQAADLGFILGVPLVGAVIGVTAAIASTIPAFLGMGRSVEDLKDSLRDFNQIMSINTVTAAYQLDQAFIDLAETSRDLAESKLNNQLSLALLDIGTTTRMVGMSVKAMSIEFDEAGSSASNYGSNLGKVSATAEKFGIPVDRVREFQGVLDNVASGAEGAASAFALLVSEFESTGQTTQEFRELAAAVIESIEAQDGAQSKAAALGHALNNLDQALDRGKKESSEYTASTEGMIEALKEEAETAGLTARAITVLGVVRQAEAEGLSAENISMLAQRAAALYDEAEAARELTKAKDSAARKAKAESDAKERTAQKTLEMIMAMNDSEIEALERKETTQLEILNERLEAGKIAQAEYEAAITEISEHGAARRSEIAAKEAADRGQGSLELTDALMNAENALFKNKSEKQRAAAQLSIGLLDKEKRENAKKIMSDAYAAAMSAYKSLAPIPFVGPALGAAAAAAILGTGAQYAAQSLAGRALGGQVRAGESYMVGERGPEVLTMGNGGGSITPNEAIRNEKSQVVNKTANVSFNIQANDTQGFDELLVQRRGLIINVINEALNDQGKAAIA